MRSRKGTPLLERLMAGVTIDMGTGCWIWQRSIMPSGYGCIRVEGRTRTTHSVAYELHKGVIAEGLQIDHLCRVRACCNPDHLEAVTPRENTLRGRAREIRLAITHCPKGHAYSQSNTYVWRNRRFCRTCQILAGQAYKRRLRAERAA